VQLHLLADRDGGWVCYRCGIELVDVCSEDDIERDQDGGRMIRGGCRKRMPTADHLVPRDLNGSNHPRNQKLACGPCNSGKGAS
jgi:5-methylcytosine-specific restriction endonuclease McrA